MGCVPRRHERVRPRTDGTALLRRLGARASWEVVKEGRFRLVDRACFGQLRSSALCLFRGEEDARASRFDAKGAHVYDLSGAAVSASTRGSRHGVTIELRRGRRKFVRVLFPTQSARDRAAAELQRASKSASLADYQLERVLGEGGYGKVFAARDRRSGAEVAIKQIGLRTTTTVRHLVVERAALEEARGSPYLGGMWRAFVDGGRLYYVLPRARVDMFDYQRLRGRMSEREALFVGAQVALGLAHLHARGIGHRDVKLENLVMGARGRVSLIDYGLAAHFPEGHREFSVVGTDHYMAPEMTQRGMGHALPVDWWQLGCLLYELVAGRPPFYTRRKADLRNRIAFAPVQWAPKVRARLSHRFVDLVEALLCKEWWRRLGAKGGADDVVVHPAFAGLPWARLAAGDASGAPYAMPDDVLREDAERRRSADAERAAAAAAHPPTATAAAAAAAAAAHERAEAPSTWEAACAGVPSCPLLADSLAGFAFEPEPGDRPRPLLPRALAASAPAAAAEEKDAVGPDAERGGAATPPSEAALVLPAATAPCTPTNRVAPAERVVPTAAAASPGPAEAPAPSLPSLRATASPFAQPHWLARRRAGTGDPLDAAGSSSPLPTLRGAGLPRGAGEAASASSSALRRPSRVGLSLAGFVGRCCLDQVEHGGDGVLGAAVADSRLAISTAGLAYSCRDGAPAKGRTAALAFLEPRDATSSI